MSKFQMLIARQKWGIKMRITQFLCNCNPKCSVNFMLKLDSCTNITSYIMYYWRTENLDISLKVQGQHLPWYFCSSQAGISLEPVDLTAALSTWNIWRLKLYFLLVPFNSWEKKMPKADDEKIHSDQKLHRTPPCTWQLSPSWTQLSPFIMVL